MSLFIHCVVISDYMTLNWKCSGVVIYKNVAYIFLFKAKGYNSVFQHPVAYIYNYSLLCKYIFVTPFTHTLHVSALDGHHQVFILP
jgi:hypothetical protein